MNDQPLIEIIKNELQNYSGVDLEQPSNNKLLIYANGENAINIALINLDNEYELFFNEYSKHFGKCEDDQDIIIGQIISCLSGNAKLEVYSKNNRPYKWKLQIKDAAQNWQYIGTTTILTLNFWTKPTIHYLQNDPLEIMRIN